MPSNNAADEVGALQGRLRAALAADPGVLGAPWRTMRRRPTVLLATALVIGAVGCFSVTAPQPEGLPLSRELLGAWDCKSADSSSSEHAQLTLLKFDDAQYYAEWKDGEKVERYRAYPVKFNQVTVLVVREVSQSPDKYWTAVRASVEKDGSVLVLRLPAKRLLDMNDDDAALHELPSKADNPDVWQTFAR